MNAKSKLKPIFLSVLGLCYATLGVAIFLPRAVVIPLYSLFAPVVLGVQLSGEGPMAFVMAGFTTLLGIFCMTRVPESSVTFIPLAITALLIGCFLIHRTSDRMRHRIYKEKADKETRATETRTLENEITYYESRTQELSAHAVQRRQLSIAARELGSVFDPQVIYTKLLETASHLFPGKAVKIAFGQDYDSIDSLVLQKKQPLLVPNESIKGNPMIAVPITMQSNVAGVIRVGGAPGPAYTRDDLRLLDILGGLASMALGNSLLFSQVEETALRDGLTGLLTHRAFQERLQSAILEASRYNQQMSVILADVDHFKLVNDNHGHQAGDQILQGFAHVLDRNVRPVDIVARYGGEEFIVILLQTSHAEAIETAERIRQDLAAQAFEVSGKMISVSSSFGVATFPADATSAQQLVRQADQRLYQAKKQGRNRVQG